MLLQLVSDPALVVLNERQLHAVLTEFVHSYNHEHPHRSLRMASPIFRAWRRDGPIAARPVLAGLHHVYERAA